MRSEQKRSELRGPGLRSEAMDELIDLLGRLEILALEAARPSLLVAVPVRVAGRSANWRRPAPRGRRS